MKIRRFREGDTEGIVRMIDLVMSEFGEEFDVTLDRDLLDIPQYYYDNGAFWVLLDEDEIVGAIGVSKVTDEICKFRRFYIKKEYRSKGFGGKLFDMRIKYAKKLGYKTAWMVTSAHHDAAIRFIKKRGGVYSKKRLFPTKRAHMFFIYSLNDEKE